MKPGWYVWSSGLEEWTPIEGVDVISAYWARALEVPYGPLRFSHAKRVQGRDLDVFVDETGRFVGWFHP